MKRKVFILLFCLILHFPFRGFSADTVRYTGKEIVNIDYHHGQLPPAIGVHNIQVFRANREYPELSDKLGWTYNHAPMLVYWNKKFYLEYLNNPVGEHVPPGQSMLLTSDDGYKWSNPVSVFPVYRIPDGTTKPGIKSVAKNLDAVMHQRIGFYVSKENKLLCLGYYGTVLGEDDSPNDGMGIGRVVREIYQNGRFGPVYFLRYNSGWNEKNTSFPLYKSCSDIGFVSACTEILENPLLTQQFVEEADRDDPIIPLKQQFKALSYYHLSDGRVVGLWKNALTSVSNDNGKSWPRPARAPGFVNGNAKIWGQRTSDGKYITVYNPSDFRWPLAISVSNDGLIYKNLLLVNGEITTMRYGGAYKSYGPQYVRGIQEGDGIPPDGNAWVTFSMNKEDIWVSRILIPVADSETKDVHDVFSEMDPGKELNRWNIYSPLWAKVEISGNNKTRVLTLRDKDEFDFAKAERIFPETKQANVEFEISARQNNTGILQIELLDKKGNPAIRLIFDNDGFIKYKEGYRIKNLVEYKADSVYKFQIFANSENRFYDVWLNGNKIKTALTFAPLTSFNRIAFRTGDIRRFPNADTPTDQDFDVKEPGKKIPEAVFNIQYLKTISPQKYNKTFILKNEKFKHFVDYFNRMEDENIIQEFSNSDSWDWMKNNIPLFECPQDNFNEIYYYRWWSFRKHIKKTPVGYAFTEFLVNRSYADKYNLISCATGHHTFESRWLHNHNYLKENLLTWFRGSSGQPLTKLNKFSSWTAYAVYNYFLVSGDTSFITEILPDLEKNYRVWEAENRLSNGLFWQYDVRDGMEEQISGGRNIKNSRPTINSYMFGNATALSKMAEITGNKNLSRKYALKADSLKTKIENMLWNKDSLFFETLKPDNDFANVREQIGFIPWYFNMPQNKFSIAWKLINEEKGFLAPFGITTAERSHPLFRTHGCCNCEWDGAVWPFATSQTLTALANLLNNYNQNIIANTDYFKFLNTYVESHYYRGKPYIGEYLDEKTGYWLKGDQERSRYYNHSTFNDLIITGLGGLRPRSDNKIEINPLFPFEKWDWFCLDNILYRNRIITVLWDKTGEKYKKGKGFYVLIDGIIVARHELPCRIIADLNLK